VIFKVQIFLTAKPLCRQKTDRPFSVLRCFLWIVSELGHSWNSQVELARSLVCYGSEVDEVFKSTSHSFG
jgi:hypothetical protein